MITTKLLLIDDDPLWCETVQIMLCNRGFEVEVAHDAITGLQRAYAIKPDAILLDVMLPGMDGWQTCQRFKEMSDVPIIMLTSLGSAENIVRGFDEGADEYIPKTVGPNELAARIKAVLRRLDKPNSSFGHNGKNAIFTQDHLMVDFVKHQITVDGKPVKLSPTEFRLLSLLIRYKGRVLPHEFLLSEVWGPEYLGEVICLRLYISYLRHKIEKNPREPSLIRSEWGVGYRFC